MIHLFLFWSFGISASFISISIFVLYFVPKIQKVRKDFHFSAIFFALLRIKHLQNPCKTKRPRI